MQRRLSLAGRIHKRIILWMRPANERRRYIVTSSLVGWAHTQNEVEQRWVMTGYMCDLLIQFILKVMQSNLPFQWYLLRSTKLLQVSDSWWNIKKFGDTCMRHWGGSFLTQTVPVWHQAISWTSARFIVNLKSLKFELKCNSSHLGIGIRKHLLLFFHYSGYFIQTSLRKQCIKHWACWLFTVCIRDPQCHDDVIKWNQFPRYWPFVRGIGPRWIPRTKASDAGLWCFLLSAPG